jgi:hypothetical protein
MKIVYNVNVPHRVTNTYISNSHIVTPLLASMSNADYYDAIWESDRVLIAYNAWNDLLFAIHCHKPVHWLFPPDEIIAKLNAFTKESLSISFYSNEDNYILRTFFSPID